MWRRPASHPSKIISSIPSIHPPSNYKNFINKSKESGNDISKTFELNITTDRSRVLLIEIALNISSFTLTAMSKFSSNDIQIEIFYDISFLY